jgi:hypothetical protein
VTWATKWRNPYVTAQERKRAKDWLEDGLGMLRKQDPTSEARVKAFFARNVRPVGA